MANTEIADLLKLLITICVHGLLSSKILLVLFNFVNNFLSEIVSEMWHIRKAV